MPREPGRRSAVALLFAAMLLGGCGGPGQSRPQSLPALPTLNGVPPISTSTDLTRPSTTTKTKTGGRKAELAAASAVVRRYYRLLDAPTNPATAAAVSALVEHHCRCGGVAGVMRAAIRRHEHFLGTGHLTSLRAAYNSNREVQVLVTFNSTASGLARQNGSLVEHTKAQHHVTESLFVDRSGGRWTISQLMRIPVRH